MDFQKQSTTWNWNTRFTTASTDSGGWQWQLQENANSNLLIQSGGQKKWKDENRLTGYFYRAYLPFTLGLYTKSWLQNDRQVSGNNQVANHAAGLFSRFNKKRGQVSVYAGYQQSQNRNRVDWGWDVGLQAGVSDLRFSDYKARLNWESNYDFYAQRQNYENSFLGGVFSKFSQFSGDSLRFTFSEMSKQYYVGDSIEQVKMYNRNWQNILYYNLSQRDLFRVRTRIESKDITYFNGRNVFLFENYLQYLHLGTRFSYTLNLRTSDQTLDNAGLETDSRARQTTLSGDFNYNFQPDRNIQLRLSYVKLQYDTPDSVVNNDDRDEQRYLISLIYRHRLSPLLLMEWEAYTYLFHQMYIFRQQSANNNWNRVYKISPRFVYQYGRITNRIKTEVLANYTVYDFDELLNQARSFVFRKYTFSDSLRIRVFGENSVGGFARLELEDKGTFFQKEFAQQVLQSYRSEFYNIFISNAGFIHFKINFGYNIYKRREWRHVPRKRLARDIVNQGPYFSVKYLDTRRLILSASVSLSNLKDSAGQTTTYSTGYIRLQYRI